MSIPPIFHSVLLNTALMSSLFSSFSIKVFNFSLSSGERGMVEVGDRAITHFLFRKKARTLSRGPLHA